MKREKLSDEQKADRYAAYLTKYRTENKKQILEANRKWKKDHPERAAAIRRKYREAHKEQILKYNAEYRSKHPGKFGAGTKEEIAKRRKIRDAERKALTMQKRLEAEMKTLKQLQSES